MRALQLGSGESLLLEKMAEIQAVVAYEGENLPLIYTCLFLPLLFISVRCSGELDKQPVGRTATCLFRIFVL